MFFLFRVIFSHFKHCHFKRVFLFKNNAIYERIYQLHANDNVVDLFNFHVPSPFSLALLPRERKTNYRI